MKQSSCLYSPLPLGVQQITIFSQNVYTNTIKYGYACHTPTNFTLVFMKTCLPNSGTGVTQAEHCSCFSSTPAANFWKWRDRYFPRVISKSRPVHDFPLVRPTGSPQATGCGQHCPEVPKWSWSVFNCHQVLLTLKTTINQHYGQSSQDSLRFCPSITQSLTGSVKRTFLWWHGSIKGVFFLQ